MHAKVNRSVDYPKVFEELRKLLSEFPCDFEKNEKNWQIIIDNQNKLGNVRHIDFQDFKRFVKKIEQS